MRKKPNKKVKPPSRRRRESVLTRNLATPSTVDDDRGHTAVALYVSSPIQPTSASTTPTAGLSGVASATTRVAGDAGDVGAAAVASAAPPLPSSAVAGTGTPPTSPYDIFVRCLERAENMLKLHGAASGAHQSEHGTEAPRYFDDAYRAAITLAISALDAYVRRFVLERVRLTLIETKPLPGALEKRLEELLRWPVMLQAARKGNLVDVALDALRDNFTTITNFQGADQITNGMRLVGTKNVFKRIARATHIAEADLRRDLNEFTTRRHLIAHQGDYDLNQVPPDEKPIDLEYVKSCIELVGLIAKHIQETHA